MVEKMLEKKEKSGNMKKMCLSGPYRVTRPVDRKQNYFLRVALCMLLANPPRVYQCNMANASPFITTILFVLLHKKYHLLEQSHICTAVPDYHSKYL